MIQKTTLENKAEDYEYTNGIYGFKAGAKWQKEQILQFLYDEITERRDYSASKMCEKVIEFINNTK
jgi:cytochrome c2